MRRRTVIESKNIREVTDSITGNSYLGKIGKKFRSEKQHVTPEMIRKNNIRIAEKKLRLLIDMNFIEDDYYLTLTFRDDPDETEAKNRMTKFIRRLRARFKKENESCKYIYIMERQGKIHFHMLLNQGIRLNTKILKQLWEYGYTKIEYYRGEAEDAIGLAKYFMKERKSDIDHRDAQIRKKWVSSNNLEKPKVKKKILKATEWRKDIKVPNGYYLDKDSVYEGVNNYGFPFRTYRLIRLPDWRGEYEQRKSTKAMSVLRE